MDLLFPKLSNMEVKSWCLIKEIIFLPSHPTEKVMSMILNVLSLGVIIRNEYPSLSMISPTSDIKG